jgi:hypothetical protein
VRGLVRLLGNQVSGFDEPGSTALALYQDPLGRITSCLFRGNIFQRCTRVSSESQPGLWKPADRDTNTVIECGATGWPSSKTPTFP